MHGHQLHEDSEANYWKCALKRREDLYTAEVVGGRTTYVGTSFCHSRLIYCKKNLIKRSCIINLNFFLQKSI